MTQTMPIVDIYSEQSLVRTVDGAKTAEEVSAESVSYNTNSNLFAQVFVDIEKIFAEEKCDSAALNVY